ncbi:MAG: hypothetical protein QG669_499 [Patescibacteria group bacterium]|jgi:hypothetical protein|nr:hypothetical protein [Patescibacteria group bacterium]
MKKILLMIFVFVFGALMIAQTAYAVIPMPFGGKVISSGFPGIICPGTGPATIAPYNLATPTPYYVAPGTPSGYGLFAEGSYVLGLYYGYMFPICETPAGIPFPVFPVLMYGTSTPTI